MAWLVLPHVSLVFLCVVLQVMFGQIESAFNTGLTQQLTTASTSSEAAAASLKASAAEVWAACMPAET
jgi:fructose-specific phosphotransferase system IIC component